MLWTKELTKSDLVHMLEGKMTEPSHVKEAHEHQKQYGYRCFECDAIYKKLIAAGFL